MGTSKQVTAGMIVIGNEILSGRTKDKNIGTIAEKLTGAGIMLQEARVIPDVEEVIVNTVNDFRGRFDYVFTTGGIGPTHDDITADSVAKAFGLDIEVNETAYEILLAHYGEEDFTPARQRMCRMPIGAGLISNPVSAAPGFIVENVHVMAGVPKIMEAMLDSILATLEGGDKVLSLTVSCMIPESRMADEVRALDEKYPDIDIGSYPNFKDGHFGVSIVARHTDKALLESLIPEITAIIEAHDGAASVLGPV